MKKLLILVTATAGLTVAICGTEISSALANTITLMDDFSVEAPSPGSVLASFNPLNPIYYLTSVEWELLSTISGSSTATITIDGQQFNSDTVVGMSDYNDSFSGVQGPVKLSFYTGFSPFDATLSLATTSGDVTWDGTLSVIYTYSLTAPTPIPAALPLFATGLGGLGLLGWRRKRKAQAAAA